MSHASPSTPITGNPILTVPNSAYASSSEQISHQSALHKDSDTASSASSPHDSPFQLTNIPASSRNRHSFPIMSLFRMQHRTKSQRVMMVLNHVKCVTITCLICVFLLSMFLLCYLIWASQHRCVIHERTLSSFVPVQFGDSVMQRYLPEGNEYLGRDGQVTLMRHLKKAREAMNAIYMRQKWSGNEALYEKVRGSKQCAGVRRQLYELFAGPWNVITGELQFTNGDTKDVPKTQPLGAGFYPEDMTKDEFNTWLTSLQPVEREKASGFYTSIVRSSGSLRAVPYSDIYRTELNTLREALRDISQLFAGVPQLSEYIFKKQESFSTNDHTPADIAWLQLDPQILIDMTVGFYETYEDQLFGQKATIEMYFSIKDLNTSQQVQSIASHLQFIEDSLPLDDKYKNPNVGAHPNPISVVNMVMNAGDAAAGVQTAAYNLPNDAALIRDYGSKRIMLKNVQEAKFQHTLVPLMRHVLDNEQRMFVNFDAFFTAILSHELLHGLGPHSIEVGGTNTTVRAALQDHYSALEECKADISGLFTLNKLISTQRMNFVFDFGEDLQKQIGITYAEKLRRSLYVTYLVSIFRSARFGTTEAHGQAVTIAFNYLSKFGGIVSTPVGTSYKHAVSFSFIENAVLKLMSDILTIQARGDYAAAKSFVEQYGKPSAVMQATLDAIAKDETLPIDIRPVYN